LWAIGTLLGATMSVDVPTSTNSDYGRIEIAVIDPALIPNKLEVVIGDRFYKVKMEVEGKLVEVQRENMEVDSNGNGGGGVGQHNPSHRQVDETGKGKPQGENKDTKKAKKRIRVIYLTMSIKRML
jgi:hypothetical protein